MNYTKYDTFIVEEEFDQTEYLPAAMKWLKAKFGDRHEFVHKPRLTDANLKYFDVSEDGKTFTIAGRKHKTEMTNPKDTVIFKIIPDEDPEEKDDEEF